MGIPNIRAWLQRNIGAWLRHITRSRPGVDFPIVNQRVKVHLNDCTHKCHAGWTEDAPNVSQMGEYTYIYTKSGRILVFPEDQIPAEYQAEDIVYPDGWEDEREGIITGRTTDSIVKGLIIPDLSKPGRQDHVYIVNLFREETPDLAPITFFNKSLFSTEELEVIE